MLQHLAGSLPVSRTPTPGKEPGLSSSYSGTDRNTRLFVQRNWELPGSWVHGLLRSAGDPAQGSAICDDGERVGHYRGRVKRGCNLMRPDEPPFSYWTPFGPRLTRPSAQRNQFRTCWVFSVLGGFTVAHTPKPWPLYRTREHPIQADLHSWKRRHRLAHSRIPGLPIITQVKFYLLGICLVALKFILIHSPRNGSCPST